MDGKFFLYRVLRALVMVFYGVFKPFRIVNRENIPEGAAVICANHTGLTDPFYMAFAVPPKYHLCLMAKQELFRFKPLGWILRGIGTFPVDREHADVNAMKNALTVLKSGKKLGIFPEGTRTHADGEVSPKAGAVRLAEKTGAPLVPMFIPRKKRLFRRNTVVVGKPVYLDRAVKRSREQLERIADDLMDKIAALGHNTLVKG